MQNVTSLRNVQAQYPAVNFKRADNQQNPYYNQGLPQDMYVPEKKKQKKNINWSLIAILTMAGTSLFALGYSILRGRGSAAEAKEVKELLKKAKEIQNPEFRREIEEELARMPHERSMFRAKDLFTLNALHGKSEVSQKANIEAIKNKMDNEIIGMDEASDMIINENGIISYFKQ